MDARLVDLNEAIRVAAAMAGPADLLVQLAVAFSNQLLSRAVIRQLTSTLRTAVPSAIVVSIALLACRACGRIGVAVDRRGSDEQRSDQDGKDAELHFE